MSRSNPGGAVATPTFSRGWAFVAAAVLVGCGASDRDPDVATSAHRVLPAWADVRSETSSDLYLRVIDWDTVDFFIGPPPTTPGAVLSDAAGDQTEPSAAQRGAGFLVTWTDTRSGDADVVAARIGRFGEVLDPDGVEVGGGPRASPARPSPAGARSTWWPTSATCPQRRTAASTVSSSGSSAEADSDPRPRGARGNGEGPNLGTGSSHLLYVDVPARVHQEAQCAR